MSAEQASGAATAAASDESKVDLGRGPGAGEGVHNNPQSTKYQDGGESRKVAEHVVRMFLDAEAPPVPADAEVELVLFNYLYNVMHKVTVKGRGSYALRVSNENAFGKTLLNARSEMAWLSALHASQAATGVVVPRPVPVASGEYVVEVKAGEGGSTRDRRCVMVEWLPGALCYKVITPELCEQAGKVMARLHEHASSWTPPEWFTLQPLEMLMCGAPWEAASEEAGKAPSGSSAVLKPLIVTSTAEQVETYKQAYALSKETLALCEALGHGSVGTIHADLHFGNMLVREDGIIQVIDFDDCGHGPFAQDMGITLFYLQFAVGFWGPKHPEWPQRRAAFVKGYTSVRPLPFPKDVPTDIVLGDIVAARTLQIVSFCARTDLAQLVPAAQGIFDGAAKDLSTWLAQRADILAAAAAQAETA